MVRLQHLLTLFFALFLVPLTLSAGIDINAQIILKQILLIFSFEHEFPLTAN